MARPRTPRPWGRSRPTSSTGAPASTSPSRQPEALDREEQVRHTLPRSMQRRDQSPKGPGLPASVCGGVPPGVPPLPRGPSAGPGARGAPSCQSTQWPAGRARRRRTPARRPACRARPGGTAAARRRPRVRRSPRPGHPRTRPGTARARAAPRRAPRSPRSTARPARRRRARAGPPARARAPHDLLTEVA